MRLPRQSTSVVLAVPLTGAAIAAGLTADLLDAGAPAAAPAAAIVRSGPVDSSSAGVPLTSLFEAIHVATPAPATARPAHLRAPERHGDARVARPARRPSLPSEVPRPNRLISDDRTLDTAVGVYTDCSGRAPVPRFEAEIDICYSDPLYFVGHNLGVFSPLMHMDVGAGITYYDAGAIPHRWRVVQVHRDWHRGHGRPAAAEPGVVAQLQTCSSPDGSVYRILDVVDAS